MEFLSLPQQAYFLGFPLQYGLPTLEEIEIRKKELNSIGVEKYALERTVLGQDELPAGISNLWRETDVYHNEITEYLPFDRVAWLYRGKVVYYTRPEFEHVLKKGEDDFMQIKIDRGPLEVMTSRLNLVKLYNLPPAQPYLNLLMADLSALFKEKNEVPQVRKRKRSESSIIDANMTAFLSSLTGGPAFEPLSVPEPL